jgi:hypothetical protein
MDGRVNQTAPAHRQAKVDIMALRDAAPASHLRGRDEAPILARRLAQFVDALEFSVPSVLAGALPLHRACVGRSHCTLWRWHEHGRRGEAAVRIDLRGRQR